RAPGHEVGAAARRGLRVAEGDDRDQQADGEQDRPGDDLPHAAPAGHVAHAPQAHGTGLRRPEQAGLRRAVGPRRGRSVRGTGRLAVRSPGLPGGCSGWVAAGGSGLAVSGLPVPAGLAVTLLAVAGVALGLLPVWLLPVGLLAV